MADTPYRGLRFLHPDLDVAESYPGLQIAATGGLEMVQGSAAIRQAVLLLLSTRPGERLMRPSYGCDLHRLVYDPNDNTTAGLAIHYVRQALVRWEPRVEIVQLTARRSAEDPGRLHVDLHYRVRRTLAEDRLTFSVSLMPPEL